MMMGRIKTWEAHRDVGWKGVRIIYGILFGAIILNAQLILSAAPNHPQTRLSSHDEENVQLSGPVARPGGPYYTMEGAEVRLNGSASRGSLGGSLEITARFPDGQVNITNFSEFEDANSERSGRA